MKKIFQKNELLFALLWIFVYVAGFSCADQLSKSIGIEKLITVCLGLVLSSVLLAFIFRNRLFRHTGLCAFEGSVRNCLYFIPLAVLSLVNVWNGFQMNYSAFVSVLWLVSMLFVGFLEEIIFRGLLFNAMRKDNLKTAVIVSSLTFGIGHIVNLLSGAPFLDTLLQIVYASAIGFLFTVIFLTGKSLLPCIAAHAFINMTSVFARPVTDMGNILFAAFQTLLSIAYGVWILKKEGSRPAA